MKKLILTIVSLITIVISIPGYSQVPQGIKYQAVARDATGTVITDKEVEFNIGIIQGSVDGILVYNEMHTVITNKFGMVALTIGQGETGDDFLSIDWSEGPYFLNVKVDGISMGTSQLLSVPFALYAKEAGNTFSGNYVDLDNKPDLSGYITDESDPFFNASVAGGITSSDTAKWNQAFDGVADSVVTYKAGDGISISDKVISVSVPDPEQPVPMKYMGGIFYVHPMQFASTVWGDNNKLIGATSETDGKSNTEKIIAVLGDGNYPAKACSDLVDFGYSDWYLPSCYELDAIYKQSFLLKNINYSAQQWSSTEKNKDMSWKLNFFSGAKASDFKIRLYTYVCIRRAE